MCVRALREFYFELARKRTDRTTEAMMTLLGYGIDLSHHNAPKWDELRGHVDFVIVRASYGTRLDEHAKEHVKRARDIGAKVGLYGFFRPGQVWGDQARALESIADSVIGPGDIVPALDIEDDPFSMSDLKTVSPVWEDGCRRIVERWCELYGDAMVYTTQRCWTQLGKPEWVLHRPLWVANYRVSKPASPGGMPPTIWQHRVDIFDPLGASTAPVPPPPGALDQNRLLLPLPLVGYRPTSDDQERVRALVFETLRQGVQEADIDTEPPPDTERNV